MFIEGIITGIIANAVTKLVDIGFTKIRVDDTKYERIFEIVEYTLDDLNLSDPVIIDKVKNFLLSQEAENVAFQIFSAKIISKDKNCRHIDDICEEFCKLFLLHVDINKKDALFISQIIYNAFVEGCITVYEEDIKKGSLSAHYDLMGLHFRILYDQIENLNKNLEMLKTKNSDNIQEYLDFEKRYKAQIIERYKYIRPPHLQEAQKIPINSLYVIPNFIDSSNKIYQNSEFINSIYRCVVLGDPGAGKTTLSKKICYDIGINQLNPAHFGKKVTPIFVELRDYGIKFELQGLSIVQYIEQISNSIHQEKPPEGAFDYLLLNGRAFVIFDGLDELLDTKKRQTISDNIDSFCNQYPSVPILVTSRKVGYEQAQLSIDRFDKYYILDFNDDQVNEYVTKWFALNLDVEKDVKDQKVNAFLNESSNVKELRSNPLILSLMCDLYRGEGYIPKNQPEVYEKCSELLFKRWDNIRGINHESSFGTFLRPTLMYIAFQIYSNENFQSGLSEKRLIEITVDYLYPKRFVDDEQAKEFANKFIDFCKTRAWVFTEIGSYDQSLFQFTHRTFLEYFTAFYLVRNHSKTGELAEILLPKIIKREWDVVSQLAVQIHNNNVEDGGDEFILYIIDKGQNHNISEKFYILSFAVRCLEFLVISPRVIDKVVKSCFELSIELNCNYKEHSSKINKCLTIDELINPLLIADLENISSIKRSMINVSLELLNNPNVNFASSGLRIITSIPNFHYYLKKRGRKNVHLKINTDKLIEEIIQKDKERIRDLINYNWQNAFVGYFYNIISLDELFKIYTPGILFSTNIVYGLSPPLRLSIIDKYLSCLGKSLRQKSDKTSFVIEEIQYLSDIIIKYPIPWDYYSSPHQKNPFINKYYYIFKSIQMDEKKFNHRIIFSFFILIAALAEKYAYEMKISSPDIIDDRNVYNKISSLDCPVIKIIRPIFRYALLRQDREGLNQVSRFINGYNFSTYEEKLIFQWINRDVKLLKPIQLV